MSDNKMDFIRAVEQGIIPIVEPEIARAVSDKLAIILNDYEITRPCTDLIPFEAVIDRLIKRFSACLSIDGKSEKTIYQYVRSIRKLSDYLQKPLKEICTYDIRYYLASEKQRGVSERSLENTRSYISVYFQWMFVEEIIPKNPMLPINPIKYPLEVRKPFSEIEIDLLRGACRTPKERALIEVLLATGVRVSELCDMAVTDIDSREYTVTVKHGKGGKGRTTYITPMALKHLDSYWDARKEKDSLYLFCNRAHEKLNPGGVRYILDMVAKRAGVANVHPHRLRRTFATNLAKRGMDIQQIQKLLGHKNINTTMEYVSTDNESVRSSYRRYIA